MEYNHLSDCKHPHAPIDVCGCEVKILKAKVEELTKPVEDADVRAHIINIAGAYPKAAGALERLARENAEYEEGNDADAEVIQLLQAKVEELEAEIVTLRNFAHGIKQTVELMLMNPPQEGE